MDREDFKLSNDDQRPLTSKGKKEFEKISGTYKKLYPDIEEFYSSDLVRAVETSDILKKKYKKSFKIIKELRPESTSSMLLKKLRKSKASFIAIVGHEPNLSAFIGYVATGKSQSIVEMKKGGACLLEIGKGSKILNLHSPKNILKLC